MCPELAVLEAEAPAIRAELEAIAGDPGWSSWVQPELYGDPGDWQLFTLFGFDKINLDGVQRTPRTCAALAQVPTVPTLKTAIFSRLRAGASLRTYEGRPPCPTPSSAATWGWSSSLAWFA